MNVNKFLKVLCLAIMCTLGTSDVFGMHESKESEIRETENAFQKMSLDMMDAKKYDVVAQELPDLYCLEKTEEEAKEAFQISHKKKAAHTRNIFRDFTRREFLPKLIGPDRLDARFDVVMKVVMNNCMNPGFMVGTWMRYLTSEQIQAVIEMLAKKAQAFVDIRSRDTKALKACFEKLPENFFKMLVRKMYHEAHVTRIDDVKIRTIFRDFGSASKVCWAECGIKSLALYSDLLAVWNSRYRIKELWLNDNDITKIEGLDSLVHLTELWLMRNQITKIEGLDNLVHLTFISLHGNRITTLEGLASLVKLKNLVISDNLFTLINLPIIKKLEDRGVHVRGRSL